MVVRAFLSNFVRFRLLEIAQNKETRRLNGRHGACALSMPRCCSAPLGARSATPPRSPTPPRPRRSIPLRPAPLSFPSPRCRSQVAAWTPAAAGKGNEGGRRYATRQGPTTRRHAPPRIDRLRPERRATPGPPASHATGARSARRAKANAPEAHLARRRLCFADAIKV